MGETMQWRVSIVPGGTRGEGLIARLSILIAVDKAKVNNK